MELKENQIFGGGPQPMPWPVTGQPTPGTQPAPAQPQPATPAPPPQSTGLGARRIRRFVQSICRWIRMQGEASERDFSFVTYGSDGLLCLVGCGQLGSTAWAATFGKLVPIGGHASDIVLDEARGVVYIANYTANRIDVMSLEDNSVGRSMSVAAQPASLALSPDGRYLVVTHFAPYEAPEVSGNALTVINLETGKRQTFGMGQAPLGVAFGMDGLALVVTTADFLLFDPVSGSTQVIGSVGDLTAQVLPVDLATFPPEIIQASVTAAADGRHIYGFIDSFTSSDSQTVGMRFSYSLFTKTVTALGLASVPVLGPRVMSLSKDGSQYMVGWGLFACQPGFMGDCSIGGPLVAQVANASGVLNVGSHAIDSDSGTIYAQVPEVTAQQKIASPRRYWQ